VLLTERAIFVLAFNRVGLRCREGVEDDALDLHDFHAGSREYPIIPVLVGRETVLTWPLFWHGVAPVMEAPASGLGALLRAIEARLPNPARALDARLWEAAPYRPVPTIVEAATMLYRRHGVAEIAAARSDMDNLSRTSAAIGAAVGKAHSRGGYSVVVVTGIPGAGKTLCGLNAVFGAPAATAFLTGNLPLVHVLREALARDAQLQGRSIRAARQHAESAIQPLTGFLRDNLPRRDAPHEHVIVFDEAQRAWDAAYGARKFGLAESEAALFLDIMRRHGDWAVIVALVGGGQEINTGEAGLAAWGQALQQRPEWRIIAPPQVLAPADKRQRLFVTRPPSLHFDPALHLEVPVRAIRSTAAAPWVDAALAGDLVRAQAIARAAYVPFFLTRSLTAMRSALRRLARGSRRAGLVCSANAKRLRADGVASALPHLDAKAIAAWFLARWPDVRAADALEVPATQFACQGLELDYVGLCWGNDLVRRAGRADWQARSFVGTRWQERRDEAAIAYQVNTYRVLLTRARYETVIWVPRGDPADATRDPAIFDAIAAFLLAAGAAPLERETEGTPDQGDATNRSNQWIV
jgi:Uncharacterized conserved protein (DUF2075)